MGINDEEDIPENINIENNDDNESVEFETIDNIDLIEQYETGYLIQDSMMYKPFSIFPPRERRATYVYQSGNDEEFEDRVIVAVKITSEIFEMWPERIRQYDERQIQHVESEPELASEVVEAGEPDEGSQTSLIVLVPNFDNLPKGFIQRVSLTAKILEKFKITPHSSSHYQVYGKEESFMNTLDAIKEEDNINKGRTKQGQKILMRLSANLQESKYDAADLKAVEAEYSELVTPRNDYLINSEGPTVLAALTVIVQIMIVLIIDISSYCYCMFKQSHFFYYYYPSLLQHFDITCLEVKTTNRQADERLKRPTCTVGDAADMAKKRYVDELKKGIEKYDKLGYAGSQKHLD
ncbi:9044_t:CDS:2 [Paraglomus occultum]|uniref:9044_t:CDS:1 n=1 Tax=Paraglomus occultum TaxID=144539 RepID=A0A9N9FGF7_9GLOM|nr:9044_t:CDS:2 [Paraglomus occultum]